MAHKPQPEMESIQSAATRKGYSIDTIRTAISEGRLVAYRISPKPGSAIRVKIADVDALMTPLIPAEVYGA